MGLYDGYDKDQANKAGMVFFIFMLVLCLLMVGANLFVAAGIAWKWVFAPICGPMALGFVLAICGIRPPQ